MKLRILSDLHIEFFGCTPPAVDADVVLLAGDIGAGLQGIAWAAEHFTDKGQQVVYVPGNHEYYGNDMAAWSAEAADLSVACGVTLGDMASVLVQKHGEVPVRIVACTLWTDFALFGDAQLEYCGERAQAVLYDYTAIGVAGRRLRWPDTKALHTNMLAWLVAEVQKANAAGEKVVVATHHAPSLKSSLPVYLNDPVSAGFASNLEAFASEHVDLWVHGHMHNSADYVLGRCRIMANPRGYPLTRWSPDTQFENADFNPVLVVEV